MAKKRPFIELFGHWLLFVVIPWLLLSPFRLIRWCCRTMRGRPQKRPPALRPNFYKSRSWQTACVKCFERTKRENGGVLACALCGRTELHGVTAWHCHHVKSRSKWPELALEQSNLAAACDDCNMGMSNRYEDLELN